METLKISKNDFLSFIAQKISGKKSRMIGVVKKGDHYAFSDLESVQDLCLDYPVTILPPKKYFQPPREVLLTYTPKKAGSYVAVNKADPITIIGIHTYDLAAIYLMDKAFYDGERDDHYLKKRVQSLLIGIFPTRQYQYRFSQSIVRDQPYRVADLMLVDMGEEFVIEIVSKKGKKYLKGANLKENNYKLKEIDEAKNRVKDEKKIPLPVEIIPEYLIKNYDHPVWDYYGEKCFSCGSCVFVCPTCYCFDITEEVDLSLKKGKRIRVWDGCLLEDFAVVADGHNFRKSRGDRFRHRIFKKGRTIPEKFGYFGCVGCGRCTEACTADIAGPVKVLEYIEKTK